MYVVVGIGVVFVISIIITTDEEGYIKIILRTTEKSRDRHHVSVVVGWDL
jgi:hypothetical protein